MSAHIGRRRVRRFAGYLTAKIVDSRLGYLREINGFLVLPHEARLVLSLTEDPSVYDTASDITLHPSKSCPISHREDQALV